MVDVTIVLKALAVIFCNLVHSITVGYRLQLDLLWEVVWQLFTLTVSYYCEVFRNGGEHCSAAGLAELLQLKHKQEETPHSGCRDLMSGGFFLFWSLTQTDIKGALCLKSIVWQLAIKTLFIKTCSVVMHGGEWRPEDLLWQNYAQWWKSVILLDKFLYLKKNI